MVNQDIVRYLIEGKKRGFSFNLLKSKLVGAGFKQEDVDEAINIVNAGEKNQTNKQPSQSISQQNSQNLQKSFITADKLSQNISQQKTSSSSQSQQTGIFKKIGLSFSHPTELFEKTKGEKLWDAIKYMLVILIVPFLFLSLLFVFASAFLSSIIGDYFSALSFSPLSILFIALYIFIAVPIISLIFNGIFHLFVKLYKGEGNYIDTFGVSVYSSTPQFLFVFIPGIGIWSIILNVIGLSQRHKISKLRAFAALITPTLIFFIVWVLAMTIFAFSSA